MPTVGFCRVDEGAELREFIRAHWSATHVLARSQALFDWQHLDAERGRINFMVAREEGQGIVGILGFILASRYDPSLAAKHETLWLTTWKVRPDFAHGLGLVLLRKLTAEAAPAWIGTVGLNIATRGIYVALGYEVGMLTRHYLLNDQADYKLASVPASLPRALAVEGDTALVALDEANYWTATEGLGLDASHQVPHKTRMFVYNRYVRHPFYRYTVYLAAANGRGALVVTRVSQHDGVNALRIVDFLGDAAAIRGTGPALLALLTQLKAEYADFYCSNLAAELAQAGFRDAAATPDLILPNHFEPFVQRNVDLLYSVRGPKGLTVVCKGDADQDRPNMLAG